MCTNITAEYTLQEENFRQKNYFINAKFAEFKSRLLIGLHKLGNDSLYKMIQKSKFANMSTREFDNSEPGF